MKVRKLLLQLQKLWFLTVNFKDIIGIVEINTMEKPDEGKVFVVVDSKHKAKNVEWSN